MERHDVEGWVVGEDRVELLGDRARFEELRSYLATLPVLREWLCARY